MTKGKKKSVGKTTKAIATKAVALAAPTTMACAHCGVVMEPSALAKHLIKAPCGIYLQRANITQARTFKAPVDVAPPTPEQADARAIAMVVFDVSMHSAIELRRTEDTVTFIPYSLAGLAVERAPVKELVPDPDYPGRRIDRGFDATRKPQPDYPTGRIAALFLGYSQDVGATSEAMAELAKLVTVTTKEIEMATQKLAGNKQTATKTVSVNAGKHGTVKLKAERKTRDSAASMFKGLIMEGKLTDDDIFKKVKEVWKLTDDKRSYVGWYRNQLKKTGQNPPAPKGEAKKPTATAKKTPKKVLKKAS